MVVTLSHSGYMKSQPLSEYRAQKRGGRGKQAAGTKDDDCTIQDSQTPFHFGGEVDVPRRIEQIDGAFLPVKGNASGEDRDASLLLLGVVVRFGRSRIDGTCPVLGAAHIQHLLGNRRLTSVDVSDDADVSYGRKFASHDSRIRESAAFAAYLQFIESKDCNFQSRSSLVRH